jgi:hypothetical protein
MPSVNFRLLGDLPAEQFTFTELRQTKRLPLRSKELLELSANVSLSIFRVEKICRFLRNLPASWIK